MATKTQSDNQVSAKNERTSFETPQITGLNMYHIFNSAATKIVFPAMQRTYSWGQEQLKRFFNNLYMDRYINQDTSAIGMFELYNASENPRHKKELHIFNGQQRIVTMFLILCNIRDMLSGAKAKDKIRYSSTISRINMLFFSSKLPNGSYQYFKIHYEGSNEMNVLLQNIADNSFIGAGNIHPNETDGCKNIRKANFFIKNWLNDKFTDLDELHEFSKFVLEGVFFAAQYHNEINRAESAFIESNLIQVHLTPIDLLRGKLISYFDLNKQNKMAEIFNDVDQLLRSNKIFSNSPKVRINELFFRHSIIMHFGQTNKSIDVMDFVFNTTPNNAQDIISKYQQWVKNAVKVRNDVNNGYEYIFLKMLAKKNVFSWTKSFAYNAVISNGKTQENRKMLLDLMISFMPIYYGVACNSNSVESVANDFCFYMKENPSANFEKDLQNFYSILSDKIKEGNHIAKNKEQNLKNNFNTVTIFIADKLNSLSFQQKNDRETMRFVLCFVEAILQHEIVGTNLYIAFKRIYDNNNIKIKQLSTVTVDFGSDYLNKIGNVKLIDDSKKPLSLYTNSNFASHFNKNTMTKNLKNACKNFKSLPNFLDVNNLNKIKCNKRLEFIVSVFLYYWTPEVLINLKASSQEKAAALRQDVASKTPVYTARFEDVIKEAPVPLTKAKSKKQLQKV